MKNIVKNGSETGANFLLYNDTAKKLYKEVKNLPIIDYHCHLSINEIIKNEPLANIAQIWLKGDHYKWRLMRVGGVDEYFITGHATDYEKFEKYMQVLTYAIGSPLYHWSKLELEKYFEVRDEILPKNTLAIYQKANEYIKNENLTPQKILEISGVEKISIVEDALSIDFCAYKKLKDLNIKTLITPLMRMDKLILLEAEELKKVAPSIIEQFKIVGCNSADFGIEYIDENDNVTIDKFSYLLNECYKNNFVVQLHFGAMRNNNHAMFERIGADKGYDSISEKPYLSALVKILSKVDEMGKMVIFNLDPADNAKISAFAVNFSGGGIRGKVQMGAAWWFNDNKEGINEFFSSLSTISMLAANIGMVTDSRSLISYVRHDYFRRLLCNYVGEIAEKGEFTKDFDVLKKIVCDVSYNNVNEFFSS